MIARCHPVWEEREKPWCALRGPIFPKDTILVYVRWGIVKFTYAG
jgi:hypothetical protein